MPEEPDLSLEDIEILDQNLRKRVETRKQSRQREMEVVNTVASQILVALKSRPDGMPLVEIRRMFDRTHSDEHIEQALQILMDTPLTNQKVEKKGVESAERFLLAAS